MMCILCVNNMLRYFKLRILIKIFEAFLLMVIDRHSLHVLVQVQLFFQEFVHFASTLLPILLPYHCSLLCC